ncbi:MAG TPA: pantoate--beta-alanine ligase [Steroidobacteraceae bacterium]
MQITRTIAELRRAVAARRDVTLVPTMGNLHDGHLSLVRLARQRSGIVVASVFVNPLQFAPHEDFATYPRTLERDCELLANGGCDIVFAPSEQELYPEPQGYKVHPPPLLADILEGQVRPGFFIGVSTVVLKLFNLVQPSAAVFGKKDYQQLLVIRDMVRQLALSIGILAAETVRDPSGLALSSRNGYLNDRQRVEAAQLNAVLRNVTAALGAGRTDFYNLEREAADALTARGWRPDYIAVRNQSNLQAPVTGERLVVLGAAKLGDTRLIDNLEV